MQSKCENCAFFAADRTICRRYPATVVTAVQGHALQIGSAYPPTTREEWCGEYTRGVEASLIIQPNEPS